MADLEIERWNNEGRVYLWRYQNDPPSYSGHHLTADESGCRYLQGLIERFREAKYPARKTFALAKAGRRQFAVPNCSEKPLVCRRLTLKYHAEWGPEKARLVEVDGEVVFEMGSVRLHEFEKGIKDISQSDGDWAMSGKEACLWFWW
jgi:hypothetical protein